ncbi:YeiH family protein [Bacillus andreraoultii]|uniref:YeiH family protein n=1 Tax=Bacillus andreraoultii TaxID=1499685 RepID=UPI000539AEDB|nr:putative sulfate exporter family transporter [Bacillus andreraoultii]
MNTVEKDRFKPELKEKQNQKGRFFLLGGVTFTFIIALIGYFIAKLPIFNHIGQMATAILIAILYRQIFGYPTVIQKGITFSSKKLLRLAIILYGLKLNIDIILHDGIGLVFRDAGVIIFSIFGTLYLAKMLKADKEISLLAGIGTGVCGAAAIAAVAPIIQAKDEDTAIGVAMIALVGTLFSIIYTILRPILPLTDVQYGIWSGMTLHELAHVALAADPAGSDATAMALLAKLGRVFLLVPLCFILIYIVNKKKQTNTNEHTKIDFPWFLLGFILMSLLGSYVLGHSIPISDRFMSGVATFTAWCLTAAMVGLGLNISLHDLRTKAIRPLVAMVTISILLSVISFFVVQIE